jgi:hypothetical protein
MEVRHIIAIDFDGTLCEDRWPEIGPPIPEVIVEAKLRKKRGDALILWTCRCGEKLEEAVAWCRRFGLEFDAVNENLPERVALYGSESRKISADEYWDDRARDVKDIVGSYHVLKKYMIERQKRKRDPHYKEWWYR